MKMYLLLFLGTTLNAHERTMQVNGIIREVLQEEVRCRLKILGLSYET